MGALSHRVVPRKNHVVVVGLRLCLLLRELGVPVLAIDSDPIEQRDDIGKVFGVRQPPERPFRPTLGSLHQRA